MQARSACRNPWDPEWFRPLKKYAAEFVGTFFLVFTIGMTVIAPGAGAMAPLAIGFVLMGLVYGGVHIRAAVAFKAVCS